VGPPPHDEDGVAAEVILQQYLDEAARTRRWDEPGSGAR
jgi:hypothetical protein